MKARIAVAAVGLVLVAVGVRGIVLHVDVSGWAVWFVGAAVLHDGVLVPLVLAAGLLTRRLPGPYRGVVRGALVAAGCVSAIALPLVLGYGRRADVPSRLPLPYGRNLVVVLGAIAAAAVLAATFRLLRERGVGVERAGRGVRLRRRPRPGPEGGVRR
ncbi:hypothetical protein [Actinomadura fibrosa]|uniref:Uncharacterized protein n=1 Tax=Actinomadura fibrosa TaxID=111802 RepID=A0ABW2XWM8_9ACTN|nr:hypothetical protein [Actinomadura fibrosa]